MKKLTVNARSFSSLVTISSALCPLGQVPNVNHGATIRRIAESFGIDTSKPFNIIIGGRKFDGAQGALKMDRELSHNSGFSFYDLPKKFQSTHDKYIAFCNPDYLEVTGIIYKRLFFKFEQD